MFVILFFLVGGTIGWLFYRHTLENSPINLHPEFFDENGHVIPDEILAIRFDNDYGYEDTDEEN